MTEGKNRRSTVKRLFEMYSDSFKKHNLWDNARFVLAKVPLDRAAAKEILPLGMWLDEPATGVLFIVDYTKTSFTVPYKEAALLINVKTPLGSGVHCPWMVVDDDTALIYGRELLGYPKKMAEFTFDEREDAVKASVTRRGVKVLSLEARRGQAQTTPPPVFNKKTFNAGGLGQFFSINPVWLFKPKEKIHESYEAEVEVRLEASPFDPIADLVAGPATSGRLVVMDIPGSEYNLPVGLAGLRFFANTFYLRFR